MKSYLSLIKVDLKLAFRDKAVIFFNYLFPLIFFFVFAGLMRAERGATISYVVSLVLVMGILGNGLFGAGLRAVQEPARMAGKQLEEALLLGHQGMEPRQHGRLAALGHPPP